MRASKDQRLRLRLRTSEFDRAAEAVLGLSTSRAVADALGVHFTVLSQYRTGRRFVGADFIAAVQRKMPGVSFERLFEVVEEVATCASE